MKKYLSYFSFLLLLVMVSCSNENEDLGQREGMVDFAITTTVPMSSIQTRDSHHGGATNVLSSKYDLRYIMEVRTKAGLLVHREAKVVTIAQGTTFNARLVAMEYDVTFWADFVTKGTGDTDLYYNTSAGLTQIDMKDPSSYGISNDARDAFYKTVELDLRLNNSSSTNVTLQRPFGKFRLIAIDAVNGTPASTPATATINYSSAGHIPTQFNALTGIPAAGTALGALEFTGNITSETAIVGGNTYPNAYVIAFDYIFAPDAHTINFNTKIHDSGANKLFDKDISNIPIKENRLTTIIGNFFTNGSDFTVIVTDPFEDDEIVEHIYDQVTIIETGKTYATIQEALAEVAAGETIAVSEGTHNLGTGISIPAGVRVQGAGKDKTILLAQNTSGSQTSVSLAGTLDGVSVTYNPARVLGTAWNSENPTGVNILTGGTLTNSRVTGHRNGVYANNVSGYTIGSNDISKNRTGIQLANGTSGEIRGNSINNNETIGLLLQYLSDNSITTAPSISNNTFSGNWSSDLENRWSSTYVTTLSDGNTFSNGTKTITVSPNSGEMSSGITFTQSDVTFKANIVTTILSNIDLSGAVLQNTILMNGVGYPSIVAALADATGGETIELSQGTYPINTTVNVNKAVTILGAPNFETKITTTGSNYVFAISAAATIDGLFFEKTNNTTQNIIGALANGITIKNSKFVGQYTNPSSGDVSRGIEGSGAASNLTITDNIFENLRQPAYLQGSASGGVISDNVCKDTRGWVITSGTNFAITGNSFNNSGSFNFTHIAIIANSPAEVDNYADIATISANNNNCRIKNDITGQSI